MIIAKLITIGLALTAALGGASTTPTKAPQPLMQEAHKAFMKSLNNGAQRVLSSEGLFTESYKSNTPKFLADMEKLNKAIELSKQVSPECGKNHFVDCTTEYFRLLNQLDPGKQSYVLQALRGDMQIRAHFDTVNGKLIMRSSKEAEYIQSIGRDSYWENTATGSLLKQAQSEDAKTDL